MVPGNVHRNAEPPYTFTNAHVVCHRLKDTPLRPSWIRSPGRMQNTYANEAFMDELAAAAGADPVEFRLRYLKDPRGAEVIKRSEEHTSELQSLMRISYAVFCLKKKNPQRNKTKQTSDIYITMKKEYDIPTQ